MHVMTSYRRALVAVIAGLLALLMAGPPPAVAQDTPPFRDPGWPPKCGWRTCWRAHRPRHLAAPAR